MGSFGDGTGSAYPSSFDDNNDPEIDSTTRIEAAGANDERSAIIAIESTLGTSPQGTASDVKTFLQNEHQPSGQHSDIKPSSLQMQGPIQWKVGTQVASSGTLPLGTDGNFFLVTGSTTITAIQSRGKGFFAVLQFQSSLTIQHNATSLILPGGGNIVTQANDVLVFFEYDSSGNYILVGRNTGGILVSSNDTTGGNLLDKLSGSGDIALVENNDGGNESIAIESGRVSSNDTSPNYLSTKIVAGDGISVTEKDDGGNETLEIANTQSKNMEVFTSSGTWTQPAGVTKVLVWAVGGGGGGTGTSRGGGGEVVYGHVTVSGNISVTVGSGGADANTDGGDTTFGSLVTANGGPGSSTGNPPASGGSLTGTLLSQFDGTGVITTGLRGDLVGLDNIVGEHPGKGGDGSNPAQDGMVIVWW